jgi:hypothetical protein
MPTTEDEFDIEDDEFEDDLEEDELEDLAATPQIEATLAASAVVNKPKPKIVTPKDKESEAVEAIEKLPLEGDQNAIVTALHPFCTHNNGIKAAKQLLRDARDRAKSRVTRISGIVNIILDEFKDPDEDKH